MLTDPNWKYENAEESRKPGYLAKKFARRIREQKLAEKKAADSLTRISRVTQFRSAR